jgi:formylglycine-generating enzyme required for sulfatase activity
LLISLALGSPAKLYATLNIPVVEVGNPHNANDGTGFGGVPYTYSIGTYEVTNSQYAEFLNSVDPTGLNTLGLYTDPHMNSDANGGIDFSSIAADGSKYSIKSGRGDNPVVFVTWYSALRFANWMHNGQGNGSTESGSYTLTGGMPVPSNASSIARNPGATWVLPTENEWYKAAYYDADTATYFDYPTQNNSTPISDEPPGGGGGTDSSNAANFQNDDSNLNGYDDGFAKTGSPSFSMSQNYLTDVGAYFNAVGPYGTFDQGGNVAEWTEALVGMTERSVRGGDWFSGSGDLKAENQVGQLPASFFMAWGFRLVAVPEPSPMLLLGFVGALTGLVHSLATRRTRYGRSTATPTGNCRHRQQQQRNRVGFGHLG